jgi:hypothetical protein
MYVCYVVLAASYGALSKGQLLYFLFFKFPAVINSVQQNGSTEWRKAFGFYRCSFWPSLASLRLARAVPQQWIFSFNFPPSLIPFNRTEAEFASCELATTYNTQYCSGGSLLPRDTPNYLSLFFSAGTLIRNHDDRNDRDTRDSRRGRFSDSNISPNYLHYNLLIEIIS